MRLKNRSGRSRTVARQRNTVSQQHHTDEALSTAQHSASSFAVAFLLNPSTECQREIQADADMEDDINPLDYDFPFGGDSDDDTNATTEIRANGDRRSGKTTIWIGGYKYTKHSENTTHTKALYRCSHYRRKERCKGLVDYIINSGIYTNFRPHVCGMSASGTANESTRVTTTTFVHEAMKKEVDLLAITTTSQLVV